MPIHNTKNDALKRHVLTKETYTHTKKFTKEIHSNIVLSIKTKIQVLQYKRIFLRVSSQNHDYQFFTDVGD